MNVSQGIYRLSKAIQWAGRGFAIVVLVVGIGAISDTNTNKSLLSMFAPVLIIALLILVIAEGVSWIIRGLADD